MISCLDELMQANALVDEYRAELDKEGVALRPQHRHRGDDRDSIGSGRGGRARAPCQFFSIGTSDLIQYSLAVDRLNEKIAHLYEPTHPAILRLIKMTPMRAKHGIWVGVCGEMAGDPIMTPLLLGLGVDELSVTPPCVPQIKYLIRRLKMSEAKELAEAALNCESGGEILSRTTSLVRKLRPASLSLGLGYLEPTPPCGALGTARPIIPCGWGAALINALTICATFRTIHAAAKQAADKYMNLDALYSELTLETDAKLALLVLDGLGDLATGGPDSSTPLEAAKTPNLDELTKRRARPDDSCGARHYPGKRSGSPRALRLRPSRISGGPRRH